MGHDLTGNLTGNLTGISVLRYRGRLRPPRTSAA